MGSSYHHRLGEDIDHSLWSARCLVKNPGAGRPASHSEASHCSEGLWMVKVKGIVWNHIGIVLDAPQFEWMVGDQGFL